jgi:peptidoglycan/LPS O-acetylase OafA/YrhL
MIARRRFPFDEGAGAIALAVVAATIARRLIELDHTPAPPAPAQLAANLLMLQDLLGMDALSAGLWYVAIDLQLYGLFVLLLWVGSLSSRGLLAVWLVAGMALASLLTFNRSAALDAWALYFFGAYGLGARAWWGTRLKYGAWLLGAIAVMSLAALSLEWRTRLALAGMTALVLAWGSASVRWHLPSGLARIIHALGKTSYAVFLMHYPICLLFNALAGRFWPASPEANIVSLLLAWITSLLAGACLYRWVEAPVNALLARGAQERPPG